MSDITVPSWRTRPERSAPVSLRMLAFAGGALGLVAVGGAVTWGLSRGGPRTVPVIEADARPVKVKPENPGGLQVPNQDQLVLEPAAVRRLAERNSGVTARLDQGPESPALDQLRLQAAPPPPPAAPADIPPIAAPAAAPAPVPAPQVSALVTPALPAPIASRPATPPPAAVQPVAAPAAAPALAPVAQGRAMIQLGALNSEDSARGEWERLVRRIPELAAFQPRISRFERGEGQAPLFRLRTGGLADAAAARSLCETVRAKGAVCTPIGG